ncbi:MAG TPA: GNAT family N-acetyltransferase [Longimicrobium sp.]|nr:GNAT family N-acetyltransferase [Longimicrobium sp.]
MTAPILRPATADDVPGLAHVHVVTWRGAYAGLLPASAIAARTEEVRREQWVHRLAEQPGETIVAVMDGRVVGFAAVGPSRDPDAVEGATGELYALYLLPERWGTRTGSALWRAGRRWLEDAGFAEATLWVLEANFRARAFYENMGFEIDARAGRTENFAGEMLAELRYRLPLRGG